MNIIKACKELMVVEPFYGFYLLNLNKEYSKDIPTLAVTPNGINIKLLINEEFWNSLTDDEQLAVLKHELIHICFFHLLMVSNFANRKLFNIAADMCVNCYIKNLPEDAVTVEKINKQFGLNLDLYLGTKEYYKALLKVMEKGGENAEKLSAFTAPNNHDTWKEFKNLDEAAKKLIENQIKYQLENTAKQIEKSRGTIPGELTVIINEILKKEPPIFNWKAYFRRLLGTSYKVFTKKSLRKQSKRFEGSAGIKIKQKQHILVAIDTSGSVSDKELTDFFSEIFHIYKTGVSVTIIECDTRINNIYEYKGKFNGSISGRGGRRCASLYRNI